MKYIISWSVPPSAQIASAARFLETGGAPPPGVKLVGRWHGMSGEGFAIAECDDAKAMYLYQAQWRDLLPIAVTPCVEDAEASAVFASILKK